VVLCASALEVPNEAAFYGPKIDVQVWSVIGREFTLATKSAPGNSWHLPLPLAK